MNDNGRVYSSRPCGAQDRPEHRRMCLAHGGGEIVRALQDPDGAWLVKTLDQHVMVLARADRR